jgi:hypothetical protein
MPTPAAARSDVDRRFFKAHPSSNSDARERGIGNRDSQASLVLESLLNPAEKCPATHENESSLHDVGCELSGRPLKHPLEGFNDLIDGPAQRLAHVIPGQGDPSEETGGQVTAANLGFCLMINRPG